MPYSVPAVFGTIRPSDEPIFPVERYDMYPHVYEDAYAWQRLVQPSRRPGSPAASARKSPLPSLPARDTQNAFLKAVGCADAWHEEAESLLDALWGLAGMDAALFLQRSLVLEASEGAGIGDGIPRGAGKVGIRTSDPDDEDAAMDGTRMGDRETRSSRTYGENIGYAASGTDLGSFTLRVTTMAQSQRNVSYELAGNAPSVIPAGAHRFHLVTAAGAATPAVVIDHGDSNIDALRKLGDAINAAALKVSARVLEVPASAGIVRLELISLEAGTGNAFALQDWVTNRAAASADLSGHSGAFAGMIGGIAVRATGIGQVAQQASDANYRVDRGSAVLSPGNDISLRGGQIVLSLERLGGPGEYIVRVQPDYSALAEALQRVVLQINRLQASFAAAAGNLKPFLRQRVDRVIASFPAAAEGLKLFRHNGGQWILDEEHLEASLHAASDALRQSLAGRIGFAAALRDELQALLDQPIWSIIEPQGDAVQRYIRYGPTSETYLQLRLAGLHVDDIH